MPKFDENTSGKAIEGLIKRFEEKNQSNKCRILFVMREPDSEGNEATDFWFQQIIYGEITDGKSKRSGTRYMNVFYKLAKRILVNEHIYDSAAELLKECGYINMLSKGEKTMSKPYLELVEEMRRHEEIPRLKNRKELIKHIINNCGCEHIVTTPEIFEWLCEGNKTIWLKYGGDKEFKKGKYDKATVYEFYHPSYPRISYEKLDMSEVQLD